MSCNTEIKTGIKVGCFPHCGNIETCLTANVSGEHHIEYNFKGQVVTFPFGAIQNGKLCFPNCFNECAEAHFRIVQPNGCYLEFENQINFLITIKPVTNKIPVLENCLPTCEKS